MDSSSLEGIFGSVVVVLLVLAIYFMVTKKVALKLPGMPGAKVAIALVVIALVGLVVWGTQLQALQPPKPGKMWEFAKNYWLWILILAGAPLIYSFFLPKEKGNVAKGLQWFAGLTILLFFVAPPLLDLFWGEKPPPPPRQAQQQLQQQRGTDCTYARPCPPALETTQVPVGSRVCFDPPVFANLEGFGLMVSSSGVAEHRYACTLEEVMDGTCKEKPLETFRFSPTNGVAPPRHWFTKDSGIVC